MFKLKLPKFLLQVGRRSSRSHRPPHDTVYPSESFDHAARCHTDCNDRATDHGNHPDQCVRFCPDRIWPDLW